MNRPVVFDLTHLEFRVAYGSPAGIDRVDLAFARHFGLNEGKIAAALHYARQYPLVLPPSDLSTLVRRAEQRWGETSSIEADTKFLQTRDWIRGVSAGPQRSKPSKIEGIKTWAAATFAERRRRASALTRKRRPVPDNAIYLNVAQHAAEHGEHFAWLESRKDVKCVFFVHDLIPLDHPEFWWAGHEHVFSRRVDTMLGRAAALITSSHGVRDRILVELKARGRPPIPILSCPLPSPVALADPASLSLTEDAELRRHPYFVTLGTIEPRKNHALLLNVWRRLATRRGAAPKLVMIGNRGWENEQVVDMLERCLAIREHVLEVAGLSNAGVGRLLANARGLLMPSFAEGYGLPLVEALSLGAPVIASDISEFHEVTQERAIFRDPIDGIGWSNAVEALSDLKSPIARTARENAAAFKPPAWSEYFAAVDDFLGAL